VVADAHVVEAELLGPAEPAPESFRPRAEQFMRDACTHCQQLLKPPQGCHRATRRTEVDKPSVEIKITKLIL
jgi:hypothetical protein